MRNLLPILCLAALVASGCRKREAEIQQTGSGSSGSAGSAGSSSGTVAPNPPSTADAAVAAKPPETPAKNIDSKDILDRKDTATDVIVKHVLLGWKDLAGTLGENLHARAKARTNDDAAKLAQEILAKLKADPKQIDALIEQYGEDPGMGGGASYKVRAETEFVPEFKQLALRLKDNEAGIVKTAFGYHVIIRVQPDPLESADILKREASKDKSIVQHVLIGWKDVPAAKMRPLDPRAQKRTKAEADKIAKEVLDKVRAGGDMVKLMAEYSEDPGSKEDGKPYEVTPGMNFVEEFKDLALRLKIDEAGIVKTAFGWHIIKRIAKVPPDPLESTAILARTETVAKSKVKHVLVGWKGANTGDARAKDRDRAAITKLVNETVAKLQKGDKIEALMAELSEDPGSAKDGKAYDVAPDSPFVEPFKNLALRLKVKEVGVVKSNFGYHIMQRME